MEARATMKSIPLVYDGHIDALPSQEFNAVKVNLSAKLDSDLNWAKQNKEAQAIQKKGLNLLWDIDLGLFAELPLPLSDTTQYRSLHLALDHFFETLLKDFESNTIGALIFKGSLDLSTKWIWDADQTANLRNQLIELYPDAQALHNKSGLPIKDLLDLEPKDLFQNEYGKNLLRFLCLAQALDYFEILSARFPSDLLPYVLFDASSIKSRLHCYQLLNQEAFDFIQIGLKNAPFHFPHAIGWKSSGYPNGFIGDQPVSYPPSTTFSSLGILVPSRMLLDPDEITRYEKTLDILEPIENIRYLSERNLTLDWEGLDTLIVFEVEDLTKRKLEGFIAAGGEIIFVEKPLGLSKETHFSDYKKQLEI